MAIVAYGALLRFDAITQIYGPVTTPRWLRGVQQVRLDHPFPRPSSVHWDRTPLFPHRDSPPTQYRSDPYTYLQYAREMRSFYAAHRREPLFPFATRVALTLLDDQDVAVSFASASFSTAAIALTFAVGAVAFSPVVGLAAAFLAAIEYDLVTTGTAGWRDDAFMCGVLLFVLALLGYARNPQLRMALLIGVAGGLACLVRLTSLSFFVPGLLWIIVAAPHPWTTRVRHAAAATVVMLALFGPFLVNCWRVYGDPLYAINVHADVYRESEGTSEPAAGVRDYIGSHLRAHPVRTIDTAIIGLTRYPFANKWAGFKPWIPGAGRWLSIAALAGMLVFACTAAGRILLVVLVTSLVPYALTWQLSADWRFTQHAYPFFLIAASAAIVLPVSTATGWRRSAVVPRPSRRRVAVLAGLAGVVALGAYVVTRQLPAWVFAESLRTGEAATIVSGDRDGAFFDPEWNEIATAGTIALRTTRAARPSLRLPLRSGQEYEGLVRIDPRADPVAAGAPVSPVHVLLNGRLIATCDTGSVPERIGVCQFRIPRDAARNGANKLTFAAAAPDQSDGFRVWYLRLHRGTS